MFPVPSHVSGAKHSSDNEACIVHPDDVKVNRVPRGIYKTG
jgi:hypothetical protein